MTDAYYFLNQATGKRYDVVNIDRDAGTITLKGPLGREFTEKFDPSMFERNGYTLMQVQPGG